MSKQVFTQVIRGAHEWVRQAEEALEKAIAEHGAEHDPMRRAHHRVSTSSWALGTTPP